MIYLYPEKNLRAYPGTARGTEEWDCTYKIRVNVEKSIHHFKDSFCIAGRKTQNEKTLHADLLPAEITQLITVIVAGGYSGEIRIADLFRNYLLFTDIKYNVYRSDYQSGFS